MKAYVFWLQITSERVLILGNNNYLGNTETKV